MTVCVCVRLGRFLFFVYRLLCFVRLHHRVQELLALGETSESSFTIDQPKPDTDANAELNPDCTDESTVKKKKKKKKKHTIKDEKPEEEATDPACVQLDASATELHETSNEEKGTGEKKKKRKKDKHLKQDEEEVQISAMEVHGSDSSGYQSDKSSKKRKHEPATDITAVGEGPEPKKSKRRKSRVEQFA